MTTSDSSDETAPPMETPSLPGTSGENDTGKGSTLRDQSTANTEPSVRRKPTTAVQVLPGDGPMVRRKIVTWRRLEPGDIRTAGAVEVPESPYLEGMLIELALPQSIHDEMQRLADAKTSATRLPRTPWIDYEPGGVVYAVGGSMIVGAWLEYLRPTLVFQAAGLAIGVVGVGLALFSKAQRRSAENAARNQWQRHQLRDEYDALSRELADAWLRISQQIKTELGFHTEIRVGEGSADPLRLVSLDLRVSGAACELNPNVWLPTGGEVAYESMRAGGEVRTHLLPGSIDCAD